MRYGSRHVSPSRTPSHQERLRDELERTHAEISQIRDCNDFCRAHGRAPPDHSYRDLEILQSRYAQLSLALEESLQDSSSGQRGRSPFIASHRVASPSDAPHPRRPDSSSLQRLRLSPRHSSSSQDRHRPRDASSGLLDHLRHSDPLPLPDSNLAGRMVRASRRSLPEPLRSGGFSEVGALSLSGGRRLPSQLLVGLEGSGGWTLG